MISLMKAGRRLLSSPFCIVYMILAGSTLPAEGIILYEHRGAHDPAKGGWTRSGSGINIAEGPVKVGLQDAWVVDDNSNANGSIRMYTTNLSPAQTQLAEEHGWRLTMDVRAPERDFSLSMSAHVQYHNGKRTFRTEFGATEENMAAVEINNNATDRVSDKPYYLMSRYEFRAGPGENGNADFFINDQARPSDPSTSSSSRFLAFGSNASGDTGRGEYALVRLEAFPPIDDFLAGTFEGHPSGVTRFSGPNDQWIIPDSTDLELGGNGSLVLHFKSDSIPEGERRRLIGKWNGDLTTGTANNGLIKLDLVGETNGRARYELVIESPIYETQHIVSGPVVWTGSWQMVSLRVTNGHVALFHNATEVATGFIDSGALTDNDLDWGIGCDGSGPAAQPDNFRGDLGAFHVYSAALSDSDIEDVVGSSYTTLVNASPFDGSDIETDLQQYILVFSQNMDLSSFNNTTIQVHGSLSGGIPATFSALTDWSFYVNLDRPATPGEQMFVDIHQGLRSTSGKPVLPQTLSFQYQLSPAADAYARDTRPRADSFAGIMVDTLTGAFNQQITGISTSGLISLPFAISYNSQRSFRRGSLGYAWTHPYEARMEMLADDHFRVYWTASQWSDYRQFETDGAWIGQDLSSQYDDVITPGFNNTWRIEKLNGQEYVFDGITGRLEELLNFNKQGIECEYNEKLLTALTFEFSDLRIEIDYDSQTGLIQSVTDINDETGEPFRHVFFEYDDFDRLITVHEPVELHYYSAAGEFSPISMNDGPFGLTQVSVRVEEGETVGFFTIEFADISHSRVSDLTVSVVSPAGTEVVLHDRTDGFPNLGFEGMRLTDFNGEDPKGVWVFRVVDRRSGVTGSLNRFSFTFSEATNPTHIHYTDVERSTVGKAWITETTDLLGDRILSVAYSEAGRVLQQDDGVDTNAPIQFDYANPNGAGEQLTTYRDRMGELWSFTHDSMGNLLNITDPFGHETAFTYDATGNRTRFTDPLGRSTTFTYTEGGRLATVTEPIGDGLTTTFEYDSNDALRTIRDPFNRESTFGYASNNNLRSVEDAAGNRDTKSYGGAGQMIDSLLEDGGGVGFTYTNGRLSGAAHMQVSSVKAELAYDPAGRALVVYDAAGHATRMGYYGNDMLRARIDELGQSELFLIDHRSRIVETIDRRGNSTKYAFDRNNNMIRQTDPLGRVTEYAYDGEDRQTLITYPGGAQAFFTYDALGRLVRQADSAGNGQAFVYDAVGNMKEVYDLQGNLIRKAEFNARNQPLTIEDANGNITRYTYDDMGRQTQLIDPQGGVTELFYDDLDRLIRVVDPLDRTFEQDYTEDDLIREIRNPLGRSFRFNYDSANRLRSFSTPGSSHRIEHDGRDLVTKEYVNGGNGTLDYKYDELSRMIELERYDGGTNSRSYIGYEYDANDNLTGVGTRPSRGGAIDVKIQREYDALNRLTRYTNHRGEQLSYTYDLAGNLASITYPDDKTVQYGYDINGRMTSVVDWADRVTRFTYNERGLINLIEFPNDTFRVMAYDPDGLIVERADFTPDGSIIVRYVYSYDGDGMLRAEQVEPVAMPYQPPAASMTYGNRNELTSFNGVATTITREGQLLTGPLGDTTVTFDYDPSGNLIQAGDMRYAYDLEDHLIAYGESGQWTQLLVNPAPGFSQVLSRSTPQGITTHYVWGIGLLYEEDLFGNILVYHYDSRGNTVAMSDSSGQVAVTLGYGPFGEFAGMTGTTDTPFRFGGMYGALTDPEGLVYLRFRWYHPMIRRFLSEDAHFGSIAQPYSINRYAYAGNNPVSGIDPTGEFPWVAAGAAIGAVVNVGIEFVSDIADDGRINKPFTDYLAAGIGGAITGGMVAACGSCGMTAGALGAGAQTTLGALFRGEDLLTPDFAVGLAIDVTVGAAFGKLGSGKGGLSSLKRGAYRPRPSSGKMASVMTPGGRVKMIVPNRNISQLATPGGKIPVPLPTRLQPKITPNVKVSHISPGNVAADLFSGTIQTFGTNGLKSLLGVDNSSTASEAMGPQTSTARPVDAGGRSSVYRRAQGNLNTGHRGIYGEFSHWSDFVRFLQMADRPVPQETARQLRSF